MKYEELVSLLADKRKGVYTMNDMAQITGISRQSLSYFENLKNVSYKILLMYLCILCTQDELGDIITNLDI